MTGPDVQAVALFAVQLELFELFLNPLPIGQLLLLGQGCDLRMFLGVTLKQAGADQIQGVVHCVDQGLGVIHDQAVRADALMQPIDKVLPGG